MSKRIKKDPLLPQTLDALLYCTNCCLATKHEFSHSNRMMDGITIEHIYECKSCKARRRWGLMSINGIRDTEESESAQEEVVTKSEEVVCA